MSIRAVFDTNVIISGALFGGVPRELLQAAIDHRLRLFISDDMITELMEVLQRPKFKKRGPLNSLLVAQLLDLATKVNPARNKAIELQDKDDHIVIDCAIAAKAEYIVTGDMDFVSYGKLAEISIIAPTEMLRIARR
ncbi:MAG: putative toxin-antitoxin system toxin component, PIN family [Spirochaetota bacterium]